MAVFYSKAVIRVGSFMRSDHKRIGAPASTTMVFPESDAFQPVST